MSFCFLAYTNGKLLASLPSSRWPWGSQGLLTALVQPLPATHTHTYASPLTSHARTQEEGAVGAIANYFRCLRFSTINWVYTPNFGFRKKYDPICPNSRYLVVPRPTPNYPTCYLFVCCCFYFFFLGDNFVGREQIALSYLSTKNAALFAVWLYA